MMDIQNVNHAQRELLALIIKREIIDLAFMSRRGTSSAYSDCKILEGLLVLVNEAAQVGIRS
jgi:hypothetical protein